ncbi:DUF4019 domain-containing protein [Qipengyuania spongiae]|uniref:DUF4019 domain-containing protein n=1 Tax=Qipengyuania spongiae TaxID=2909673 RepID=UPI003B96CD1D
MVRGYDAKSLARRLDVSIHTVNERLRNARRKLEVSSSREAGRLLAAEEAETAEHAPQSLGSKELGDDSAGAATADDGFTTRHRAVWITGGIAMSIVLASLALVAALQTAPVQPTTQSSAATESDSVVSTVLADARAWLALVDAGNWQASWEATGNTFRKQNTLALWSSVSEDVRVPLGRVVSRELVSQDIVPTPPNGHRVIKFRTSFANKPDTVETVALVRDGADWRVVGYLIG